MKPLFDPQSILSASQKTPEAVTKANQDRKALKKSCQDFEAVFIQSMFKAMRKTVPDGGLFEKNTATTMYQDMLDSEIAQQISQKQSLGLAEQMYQQMIKTLPTEK